MNGFDNKMAAMTACRVCEKLRGMGIGAWLYGAAMRDTDNVLRIFANKAKQYGILELIPIRLDCGGMLAVTADCKIVSEHSFMCDDGFTEIAYEYHRLHGNGHQFRIPYFCDCGFECYGDEEEGLAIAEPFAFSRFLDALEKLYKPIPSVRASRTNFCDMISWLEELRNNYHTWVRVELIDEFVKLASSWGMNPQGGALSNDCKTQVIYIDRPHIATTC